MRWLLPFLALVDAAPVAAQPTGDPDIFAFKCPSPYGSMVSKIETARAMAMAIALERRTDPSTEISVDVEIWERKPGHWRVHVFYHPAPFGGDFSFVIRQCDGAIVQYVAGR